MDEKRHPIYQNALDSIRIAVADFQMDEPARLASAVRNLSTGLLLLCKEKLRRMSPADEILVWKKIKLVPGDTGKVEFQADGQNTVDVHDIEERFKAFQVAAALTHLKRVIKVRNKLEHHYVEKTEEVLAAFVDGLYFLRHFLPVHLSVEPVEALGLEAWSQLLENKTIFDSLKNECEATFANLDDSFAGPLLLLMLNEKQCINCASPLLKQGNSDNDDIYSVGFVCESCGSQFDFPDWVMNALQDKLGADSFIAAKEGTDGPTGACPDCGKEAYVFEEQACLACGFDLPKEGRDCLVCGDSLGLDDYTHGDGLCGYHRYVMDRERDA